jgi:hypothetical protein
MGRQTLIFRARGGQQFGIATVQLPPQMSLNFNSLA